MMDIIMDTLIDGIKLIPFLWVAFLLIEFIEHKLSKKNKKAIANAGVYGPVLGGILGAVPQCGFSVMATNLYVTRIITLGTLISVYLSTSDEMIPILLSQNVAITEILKIVLLKVAIGMACGFAVDWVLRRREKQKPKSKKKAKEEERYEICEHDHCHCESGILASSIKHTANTLVFILLTTFLVNIVFTYVGEDALSKIFLRDSVFGSFITSLIGLIPNCGSSIMITELYLNGAISFGSLIGGLLTGSGVGLLVLFRANPDMKENVSILGLVYGLGAFFGFMINLLAIIV